MDDLNEPYLKYWGEAARDDTTKYHLLPFHCLDDAAVGEDQLKNPLEAKQFQACFETT